MSQQNPILRVSQVSLKTAIASHYLLQDISFEINYCDRIALIGSSGAGKTSLLRLLNRLAEPSTGIIEFANQPLTQIPSQQLRTSIVLVPQEPKMLGMNVQEALAYPLVLQQLPSQEIQQRLVTWRARLHIPEDWLERDELQLSLGQRQLVTITRALAMQPKILLLDEPTSALDAGTAHHLMQILRQLSETTQTSILMVNHQLDLVQQFAQRVLYLQQGQLLVDQAISQVDWLQMKDKLIQAEADKDLNCEC